MRVRRCLRRTRRTVASSFTPDPLPSSRCAPAIPFGSAPSLSPTAPGTPLHRRRWPKVREQRRQAGDPVPGDQLKKVTNGNQDVTPRLVQEIHLRPVAVAASDSGVWRKLNNLTPDPTSTTSRHPRRPRRRPRCDNKSAHWPELARTSISLPAPAPGRSV